jgi:hypothetical protein
VIRQAKASKRRSGFLLPLRSKTIAGPRARMRV